MAYKSFRINSIVQQSAVIIAALVCVVAVYFTASWCFGSTVAQQAQTKEAAEIAIGLAPSDSQGYQRLAALYEKTFINEDLPKAMEAYEKAAALSPYDYRLWLALGRSRERNGDPKGAEKALRRAVELAPNYAEVHWTLGNQLLRQGNDEEAFIEIRQAVEQDKNYAAQAVFTAWQIFDGDVSQISPKIGDSIPIKAGLAPFLAKQGRFDEALAFWNSIPENEMSSTYKAFGDEIFAKLIEKKEFRKAFGIYTQINKSENERFLAGTVFNGDFEREVKTANAGAFDWQITAGQQPQIGLDSNQKHGGGKSLVLIFNSQSGQEFRPVSQIVIVESGKSYKFEAFYRSELKTASTLQWEIADANDGKVLATTQAAAASADWSPLSAEFSAQPATQAVIIRLARAECKQGLCPISGKIWFDDINLK